MEKTGPLNPLRPPGSAFLWAVVLASLGLRFGLVFSGGQDFWPDEVRYYRAIGLLRALAAGDVQEALVHALRPDHTLFPLLALPPAAAQIVLRSRLGLGFAQTSWLPALFLALFSTGSILLVHRLALRLGAREREAGIAALLTACSGALFYYSRHLLPYDASLLLALAGLLVGLAPDASRRRSFVCGLLAAASFLTYNGHFALAGLVPVLHVLAARRPRAMLTRGLACTAGLLTLPALLGLVAQAAGVRPFWARMGEFSTSITQGDPAEGWRVVWEYLWHADRAILLLGVAGATGGALLLRGKGADQGDRRRLALWVALAAALYAVLAFASTGLGRFVVYGRLSRQLVPFLCLAGAVGIEQALGRWRVGRAASAALAAALAVQAAVQFAVPLAQRFPGEIRRDVAARFANVAEDATVVDAWGAPDPRLGRADYVLLNARMLYPIFAPKDPPPGRVLLQTAHPLQFVPYQYEGYAPRERAILRGWDVSMRLVDVRPTTVDSPESGR